MGEVLNMDGLTRAGKMAVFYYAVAIIAADYDYNYDSLRLLMKPSDKRRLDAYREQIRRDQWNPEFLEHWNKKGLNKK